MIFLNFILTILLAFSVTPQQLWREDGKCGSKYVLEDGAPGQCNPSGDGPRQGPCCSSNGFCGNTPNHCECVGCKDYNNTEVISVPSIEKKIEVTQTTPSSKQDTEIREPSETFTISQGNIKGHKVVNDNGEVHYQFRGIPYAQPPVGRLRFKHPLPAKKWTGTLEAFENGPKCFQEDYGKNLVGTEDCLHLNIYTKQIKPKSEKLPVMIWIHGGGFYTGSGSEYIPSKLIEEEVIVVTINYRLGIFGFLTFGNDKVSGNMGLRDQAEAIQWVKRNIDFIGGDPNKITIFGQSAGGMSVHAQVLSPKNFGQLAGAIAQSGSLLHFGDLPSEGKREEQFAVEVARKFNCSGLLDQSSLFCLQQVDRELLTEGYRVNPDELFSTELIPYWRPVVDDYSSDPFLPLTPLLAMKLGIFNRIPFISGTVKNEGLGLFVTSYLMTDSLWQLIGPQLLHLKSDIQKEPTKTQSQLTNITKQYYTPKSEGRPDKDIITDSWFVVPDQVTVKAMSEHNPAVFNYHFTQQTNNSFIGDLFNVPYEETPVHSDELQFLVDRIISNETLKKFSEEEKTAERIMIELWTNFAKSGHPSSSSADSNLPVWKPVDFKQEVWDYMDISSSPVMKTSLYTERMLLWDRLLWGPKIKNFENKLAYKEATEFLQQELQPVLH